MRNFQESLKYYRKARKLTQDELGEILGVSRQTIYKYESGVMFPPTETLEKILNYFQIDPNTLFKYENSSDDDMEEIKNMILNHKRLYHELGFFHGLGKNDTLEDIVKKDYPDLDGKYSQDDVLDFQRYLLLQNIKKAIIKMEQESFKQGNPIVQKKRA